MRASLIRILFPVVLVGLSSCVVSWDGWGGEPPNYVTYQADEAIQPEDEVLDALIELGVGKLEVQAGEAGKLYDVEVYYDGNAFEPDVDFRRSQGTGRLEFHLRGRNRGVRGVDKTRLSLGLSPETRLRLRMETGVAESEIDLTGLKLESLNLRAGVGKTSLAMLSPNSVACDEIEIVNGVGALEATGLGNLNMKRLVLKGGVGGGELDFSGAWKEPAEVRVEVGVGGLQLRFPRDLGIELSTSSSFLSSIDTSDFDKREGRYFSEGYDQAQRKIRVSISGGIGGVDIDWM